MGSRAEAEQIALDTRAELGLGPFARLDPARLLAHLEIPTITLTQLGKRSADPAVLNAIHHLQVVDTAALSAATVFLGRRRIIIHNDSHPTERVNSNLAHEAAHALLFHEPRPAVDSSGCRDWQDAVEKDADHLAGCLLIPGRAARAAGHQRLTDAQTAHRYGVSEAMARYRINMSGGRRARTAA